MQWLNCYYKNRPYFQAQLSEIFIFWSPSMKRYAKPKPVLQTQFKSDARSVSNTILAIFSQCTQPCFNGLSQHSDTQVKGPFNSAQHVEGQSWMQIAQESHKSTQKKISVGQTALESNFSERQSQQTLQRSIKAPIELKNHCLMYTTKISNHSVPLKNLDNRSTFHYPSLSEVKDFKRARKTNLLYSADKADRTQIMRVTLSQQKMKRGNSLTYPAKNSYLQLGSHQQHNYRRQHSQPIVQECGSPPFHPRRTNLSDPIDQRGSNLFGYQKSPWSYQRSKKELYLKQDQNKINSGSKKIPLRLKNENFSSKKMRDLCVGSAIMEENHSQSNNHNSKVGTQNEQFVRPTFEQDSIIEINLEGLSPINFPNQLKRKEKESPNTYLISCKLTTYLNLSPENFQSYLETVSEHVSGEIASSVEAQFLPSARLIGDETMLKAYYHKRSMREVVNTMVPADVPTSFQTEKNFKSQRDDLTEGQLVFEASQQLYSKQSILLNGNGHQTHSLKVASHKKELSSPTLFQAVQKQSFSKGFTPSNSRLSLSPIDIESNSLGSHPSQMLESPIVRIDCSQRQNSPFLMSLHLDKLQQTPNISTIKAHSPRQDEHYQLSVRHTSKGSNEDNRHFEEQMIKVCESIQK